jgi:hypothetical protein
MFAVMMEGLDIVLLVRQEQVRVVEWSQEGFGQFVCPSAGVFHCTHSNGIRYTGLLTVFS